MGGGMAESTFGTDTVNVLAKGTIYATITFFIICLGLYLGYMASLGETENAGITLPEFQTKNLSENVTSALDSQDAVIDMASTENSTVTETPTVEATAGE